MKVEISLGTVVTVWYFIKKWYEAISKIIDPLIQEVEKQAHDGLIDRKDRKAIVMRAISVLEKEGRIKLNFLSRLIISKIVDIIAKKLPDFTISQNADISVAKAKALK